MSEQEVKLMGASFSPFSRRVESVLKLKGVPYEYIEEDVYGNKSPMLLKYNPLHKKVPVLVYNGEPIAESLVIMEFIDETWEHNPILPRDPYQRATARFWAKFINDKCAAELWKACWSKENERVKAVEEACESLKILENELKDKTFFGGDCIGFVDIAANFIGYWLGIIQQVSGIEMPTQDKFPRLYNWTQEFINHIDIKETLPPRDQLIAWLPIFAEDK